MIGLDVMVEADGWSRLDDPEALARRAVEAAFDVTEGNRHDIVPAPSLVERTRPQCRLPGRV